mmetsp:Transcript_62561/g.97353  ORF Transcript_62561/g.97353 Transcript_62561/m.97353 type:complete len:719 (-) Transcript_62561:28-2184(-)
MGCIKSSIGADAAGLGQLEKMYKLDSNLLGSGSYAKVYRAKEIKTGKIVAVKRINKAKSKREYLDVEITIMRRFGNHKHIVSLFACYETESEVQLVIEYMSGGELFDVLNENGPYGEADAAKHVKAIGSALSFLHGNNVAHRDLKPENLLLTSKPPAPLGVLKISDFGLAKVLKDNELMHKACGTWAYCAPEVLRIKTEGAGNYDVRCDMFSVGVLLFIILAGYHPFDVDGRNTEQRMQDLIIKGDWDFNDEAWDEVCQDAKDLITALLEPNPARRITANQLLRHSWTAGISPYGSLSWKINSEISEYRVRMKHKALKAGLISTQAMVRLFHGQGKHVNGVCNDEAKIDEDRRSEARRHWQVVRKAHKSGEIVKDPCRLTSAIKAAHNRFLRFQATPHEEKHRGERINQLFEALDADRNGWLDEHELFQFAKLMEFPGDKVQWNKEYGKLCVECGWDVEAGIDSATFALLVNTQECNFYHTNVMLDEVLAQLLGSENGSNGCIKGVPPSPSSATVVWRSSQKSKKQDATRKKTVDVDKAKSAGRAKSKAKAQGARKEALVDDDAPKREVSALGKTKKTKPKAKHAPVIDIPVREMSNLTLMGDVQSPSPRGTSAITSSEGTNKLKLEVDGEGSAIVRVSGVSTSSPTRSREATDQTLDSEIGSRRFTESGEVQAIAAVAKSPRGDRQPPKSPRDRPLPYEAVSDVKNYSEKQALLQVA